MKKLLFIGLILLTCSQVFAQSHKTENLIIITLDGYRWNEVFQGAEKDLLANKKFISQHEKTLMKKFWAPTPEERREKLMPFFWNYIVKHGQLYGNRDLGNLVNVKNPYWFSYPGYSEIFTGYPDPKVNSNGYPPNPNTNVLEYINKQRGFRGKVAAFASWNAFSRILNEKRSNFPVNDGYEDVEKNLNGKALTETQKVLNYSQHNLPKIMGSERLDGSTYSIAKEFLKVNKPRVLYISFGDPDEFAHHGEYDFYLECAHYIDGMIEDLWNYLQSQPRYKNKTTLFITVDHGRGYGDEWTSHGSNIKHADEIWFAVMGPDTPAKGEIKTKEQLYQNQFAQTLAAFLGMHFETSNPTGEAVKSVMEPR